MNPERKRMKTGGHFDEKLLEKFYRKKCTPEEREQVEKWFIGLEHRKKVNRKAEEEWQKTTSSGNHKELLEGILYKIHYYIRIDEYKREKEKEKFLRFRRVVLSIAMSVVFMIAGFWYASYYSAGGGNVYSEIYAPYGSRLKFSLPDGSSGWLNSGSSLKYPVRFSGRKRLVYLEGEGYFDVRHISTKPFIVQTGNYRVIALGTSFNVQAFKNEYDEEISLVKGKVVIDKKLLDNTYKHMIVMRPGQHVELNTQTGRITHADMDADKYVAWKDGKLIFRNDPLSRVIREMGRYYNADIEVRDPQLYKYHFHATFEDETLFEALRLLTMSSAMDFKICERKKKNDGTYSRRKVILYKKN